MRWVNSIYKYEETTSRSQSRPKIRWEDDVLSNIKMMKVNNWMKIVQNSKEWKTVVEKAKTLVSLLKEKKKKIKVNYITKQIKYQIVILFSNKKFPS